MAKLIVLDNVEGRMIADFYSQMIQNTRSQTIERNKEKLQDLGFLEAYEKEDWATSKYIAFPELALGNWHIERIEPKSDKMEKGGVRKVEKVFVIRHHAQERRGVAGRIKSTAKFTYSGDLITGEKYEYNADSKGDM